MVGIGAIVRRTDVEFVRDGIGRIPGINHAIHQGCAVVGLLFFQQADFPQGFSWDSRAAKQQLGTEVLVHIAAAGKGDGRDIFGCGGCVVVRPGSGDYIDTAIGFSGNHQRRERVVGAFTRYPHETDIVIVIVDGGAIRVSNLLEDLVARLSGGFVVVQVFPQKIVGPGHLCELVVATAGSVGGVLVSPDLAVRGDGAEQHSGWIRAVEISKIHHTPIARVDTVDQGVLAGGEGQVVDEEIIPVTVGYLLGIPGVVQCRGVGAAVAGDVLGHGVLHALGRGHQ